MDFHSFSKYLLSTYYVPGSEDTAMNQKKYLPLWSSHGGWGDVGGTEKKLENKSESDIFR